MQCEECRREIEKPNTPEEMQEEMERLFSPLKPDEDVVVLCDPCWRKLMARIAGMVL